MSIHPGALEIYQKIGEAFVQLGLFDKAVEAYQRAIQISPKSINAKLELGQVYLAFQDFQAAESLYKKIRLEDRNVLTYVFYGDLSITKVDINAGEFNVRPRKRSIVFNAFLQD